MKRSVGASLIAVFAVVAIASLSWLWSLEIDRVTAFVGATTAVVVILFILGVYWVSLEMEYGGL